MRYSKASMMLRTIQGVKLINGVTIYNLIHDFTLISAMYRFQSSGVDRFGYWSPPSQDQANWLWSGWRGAQKPYSQFFCLINYRYFMLIGFLVVTHATCIALKLLQSVL